MVQIATGLVLLDSLALLGRVVALPGGILASIGNVIFGVGMLILVSCAFIGAGAVLYSRFGARTVDQSLSAARP